MSRLKKNNFLTFHFISFYTWHYHWLLVADSIPCFCSLLLPIDRAAKTSVWKHGLIPLPPSSCSSSYHARGRWGFRGPFQLKHVARASHMDFERRLKEEADVYFGDFFEAGHWSAMWCKASHERRRRLSIDQTWLDASVEKKILWRVLVSALKFFV